MKEKSQNNLYSNDIDAISLYEIVSVLLSKKIYIIFLTFSFTLFSVIYAISLPNIYKSDALLMPEENEGSMGSMLGAYSGVASIAGIALPSESVSKSKEAIARIQSFEFFSKHVFPNIAIQDLVAVDKWDSAKNRLIYNENKYNPENGEWVQTPPSVQEAYSIFTSILNIAEDKRTSFVFLSIKHKSPHVAQKWNKFIIDKIDRVMRDEDKYDVTRSVEYLNSVNATLKNEEIKKSLSSLQQDQMKRLMVLEANKNYVFKVLDSPIIPEKRYKPSRSYIVLLCTALGFVFSALLFITLHYRRVVKTE